MKMHVKQGAIITIQTRDKEFYTGKVLFVNDYELVLQPQAYVANGKIKRGDFVKYSEVLDIMVDDPEENEYHYDKDEIIFWKYFTIERWRENYGSENVYSCDTCVKENYEMSRNDGDNPKYYCHRGDGNYFE